MLSVAKYSELEELDSLILDTYLPTGKRSTSLIYGRIVSNPFTKAKIPTFPGYNQTINEVPPGNGNGPHIHKNTEIFLFLDGKWEIGYGYDACEKEVLELVQSDLGMLALWHLNISTTLHCSREQKTEEEVILSFRIFDITKFHRNASSNFTTLLIFQIYYI